MALDGAVDLIFSTATFHWVRDHDNLINRLFATLNPGGWLIAQCGGGPNIEQFRNRALAIQNEPDFAPFFADWEEPWTFSNDADTAERMAAAGFTSIETSLEFHPANMADAGAYREFVRTVILKEHLRPLPNEDLIVRYVDTLTALAANDDPPYQLDYWRLNLRGQRPMETRD
jgi:trans-aconitate 2-methyltransferase